MYHPNGAAVSRLIRPLSDPPIPNHPHDGRTVRTQVLSLPPIYLRDRYSTRNKSYRRILPSACRSRQNRHKPTRSSSPKDHALQDRWLPICEASLAPLSSTEPPSWRSLRPFRQPSTRRSASYTLCQTARSNHQ